MSGSIQRHDMTCANVRGTIARELNKILHKQKGTLHHTPGENGFITTVQHQHFTPSKYFFDRLPEFVEGIYIILKIEITPFTLRSLCLFR